MLHTIENLPAHVAGFIASGQVTKADYERTIVPALDAVQKTYDGIHFILVLETRVGNFSLGAWYDDVKVGLKHFTKWKKVAIVTDEKIIERFSDIFSFIMPGEVKGFTLAERDEAIAWVSKK
ncbi:MAG: hypothetical protein JWQ96_1261 [Segetibacter sp.]|nr:hypothetical protein [Segetibacter sp.]